MTNPVCGKVWSEGSTDGSDSVVDHDCENMAPGHVVHSVTITEAQAARIGYPTPRVVHMWES